MKPTISKSQYIKGLQCPKALWFYRFRKDLKPEIDAKTQTRFDTGNEISLLAQNYFHDGIEVSVDYWQINKAEKLTRELIKNGHNILYEATAISPVDGSHTRF